MSHHELRAHLKEEGWSEQQIDRGFHVNNHKKHTLRNILSIACSLLIVFSLLTYFLVISPGFVKKPHLEKPQVLESSEQPSPQEGLFTSYVPLPVINDSHIDYVLNEIGVYKLHSSPLQNDLPKIEVIVRDINLVYAVIIDNNKISSSEGQVEKPDLRITTGQEEVIELLKSDDLQKTMTELVKKGEISVQLLADKKTLMLKGYKSIYNAIA